MKGRQEAVMWIGLALIIGNFFVGGGQGLSSLFSGAPNATGAGTGNAVLLGPSVYPHAQQAAALGRQATATGQQYASAVSPALGTAQKVWNYSPTGGTNPGAIYQNIGQISTLSTIGWSGIKNWLGSVVG